MICVTPLSSFGNQLLSLEYTPVFLYLPARNPYTSDDAVSPNLNDTSLGASLTALLDLFCDAASRETIDPARTWYMYGIGVMRANNGLGMCPAGWKKIIDGDIRPVYSSLEDIGLKLKYEVDLYNAFRVQNDY